MIDRGSGGEDIEKIKSDLKDLSNKKGKGIDKYCSLKRTGEQPRRQERRASRWPTKFNRANIHSFYGQLIQYCPARDSDGCTQQAGKLVSVL